MNITEKKKLTLTIKVLSETEYDVQRRTNGKRDIDFHIRTEPNEDRALVWCVDAFKSNMKNKDKAHLDDTEQFSSLGEAIGVCAIW